MARKDEGCKVRTKKNNAAYTFFLDVFPNFSNLDHITPAIKSSHSLPVSQRIEF